MRLGPALGDGPVYPVASPISGDTAVFPISPWREAGYFGIKVLWVAPPNFAGRVLIRGVAADGTTLRFGQTPTGEMRFEWKGGASDAWVEPDGWREAGGNTWVPGPGCSQWQVDIEAGSRVVVFRACGGPDQVHSCTRSDR
jgi:hypothetical protein